MLSWLQKSLLDNSKPKLHIDEALPSSITSLCDNSIQDIEILKNLLSKTDTSVVIVEAGWFLQLENYIQGGAKPMSMQANKLLTKNKKLRKNLKAEQDYYFLYQNVWEKVKTQEDETITLDINKKLRKMKYLDLAKGSAERLLQDQLTERIDPTDLHLPNVIPRNEAQSIVISARDDEDLKKDSVSTNFSSITQTDSDCSNLSSSLRLQSGRVGLENPGLFCYLNSGIQCLLSINPFVECMFKLQCMGILDTKEVSLLISKLIKSVFSMRCGTVKPSPLWKYIVKYFPSNKQHDMPELVRFIINQIESELGEGNYIQKSVLNGMLCSNVQCTKCMNISSKHEPFIDLQIELSESVDKSIQLFTQEEILSNGYYCNNCKSHTQAIKSLNISKPPNFLMLQLKRFRQLPYPHKLSSYAKYKRKMAVKTMSGQSNYELIAVGVHIGSINSGHYIAYAKRSKNWYCFDDSLCTKTPLKSVLSQHAYMLVYKLIN
ncbi:hypothetical protein SteCoe_9980 [Stentor coeruleus]|uniref:Uncharacterized protein n=1 Tax=Stentor coeruleus TaxID=5963 RepID=A0A1R2CGL1_9CILI|nr:hypothetical protein SteCoe_9980 [Stentor coeruleus]